MEISGRPVKPMQTPVPLSEQMTRGPVVGPINLIPSAVVVEQLCVAPFDFVWMDMEHGPQTIHDLANAVAICLGRGITPIARVPAVEDWAVKWVLDQGVRGVVFPFVNTVEEARRAISACRYPPAGHRGYFPDLAATRWGTDEASYHARANDEIAVILQIEDDQAVRCVEEIAALEGWDVLFIGPMDLSSSYGKLGDLADPEVAGAIGRVLRAARDAGGHAGILATTPEEIARRLEEGFDFIVVNPDIAILSQAIAAYWAEVAPVLPARPA